MPYCKLCDRDRPEERFGVKSRANTCKDCTNDYKRTVRNSFRGINRVVYEIGKRYEPVLSYYPPSGADHYKHKPLPQLSTVSPRLAQHLEELKRREEQ